MKQANLVVVVLLSFTCGSVAALAQTAISADGVVESTSGGFKFPDGSTQTTAAAGGAPVEDTGAAKCYDTAGTERNCTGTGEDREFQAGVAWPTPRFTDNGNGTVTDNLTNLIWLKDANCPGARTWQGALDWVKNNLNAGGTACADYTMGTFTDWRLPNVRELQSLLHHGVSNPAVPDGSGVGQWSEGDPFSGVQLAFYWSSTTSALNTSSAWGVRMDTGLVTFTFKPDPHGVWLVRGGQ